MSQKKKKTKKKYPLSSPNTPSQTTKKQIPWKIKKSHLPTLKNNQTSPSHATQLTNLWISPHPFKKSPLPIL
jgi:hypothetical protein